MGGEQPLNSLVGRDKHSFSSACETWWGSGSPESCNEFWKAQVPRARPPPHTDTRQQIPCLQARWQQEEALHWVSARLARQLGEGKPSYPLPVPNWGWDQGKASTCTIDVRMVAGGGAISKKPVSLAGGKEGIGWRMDPPGAHGSLGWEST